MIFIAEIGLNHNGNFDLCYELIKKAKYSGADIVKFQLGWRDKKGEINQFKKTDISNIIKWSKYFEIEPMFSIFSEKALDLLINFNLANIKIASRTLFDNPILSKKIVLLKKNTFISLGMWSNKSKLPFKSKNISYLWCISKYPSHLIDLKNFPKKFNENKIIGYSDHCIGIETCLIAISRGASVIEKHFTLDKSNTTIRDHALSATPNEFKTLVNLGRDINRKIKSGL